MSDAAVLRFGAVSLILGGILAVPVNVMHPRASDPSDLAAGLRQAAESELWIGIHVGILVAVLLVVAGLVAIARSIERARGFATLAGASAVVSAAVWATLVAIDGFATKRIADAWAAAAPADKPVALRLAEAFAQVNIGLFTVGILVLFGATFVLYGVAIVGSYEYPAWLGWAAVVTGIAASLVGFLQAYQGPSVLVTTQLFLVVSLVQTLWVLALGVFAWRRASAMGARAPAMA